MQNETTERPKAKKITDLQVGVYRGSNVTQVYSDYGENYIITIHDEQYFTNKRLCRAIAMYAKAKTQMPSIVAFSVIQVDTFKAEDGHDITYAKLDNVAVF